MADQLELAPVERTALLSAALRAEESRRRDRLFNDPFAARLAGENAACGRWDGPLPPAASKGVHRLFFFHGERR